MVCVCLLNTDGRVFPKVSVSSNGTGYRPSKMQLFT